MEEEEEEFSFTKTEDDCEKAVIGHSRCVYIYIHTYIHTPT